MKELTKLKKEAIFLLGLTNPLLGFVLYWLFEENNDKTIQEAAKLLKKSAKLGLIICIAMFIGSFIYGFVLAFIEAGAIA